VFPPGVHSQTITVPIYGDRKGEADEYLTINLANPEGALLRRGSAQVTILDDEPHVSIDHSFYDDPLNVVEGDVGNTPTEFTVTLSKAYDQEVTVDYYTSTGHINDIIAASGTLTFAPGETEKTITVQVINDLIHEDLEAFNVYLTNPSFNTYLGNGAGYCYIEDNDPLPTVSINDVSVTEGNSGTKTLTFTVTLSAIAQYEVGIDYTTSDGTATTANKDYVARSGAVYIDAGELTTTVKITVRGDTKSEQDELFFVNLLSAGGAAIADSHGVGTILNDDSGPIATPKLRIGNAAVTEGQSGTKLMQFTVTLSSASEAAVEVKYTTRNGTARVSNNDYQAASGTLTFAPGETTKTIFIEINGDKKKETDEFFYILLSSAKGASFADSLGKGIIRNDDSIR
jgi:chitinase